MEPVAIRNQITLRGTLRELPVFSHENHGKSFYRFYLEIPRLSGALDVLPVIVQESILNQMDLSGGEMVTVVGQIRSHNVRQLGRRHLMIFVFAFTLAAEDNSPVNQLTLDGLICRNPIWRRTPLGREICDIMLAVPRAYHRADYIPCILWGKVAGQAVNCNVGDRICINGRLQSRIYSKLTEDGLVERVAYEVSALTADFPPIQDNEFE